MGAKWPIRQELILLNEVPCSISAHASPLHGYPQHYICWYPFDTWVDRGPVRVKCLAQEHYTMSPARAQTWMAGSRNMCTNNEADVPPQPRRRQFLNLAGILWSFKIGEKADWSFYMLFYDLQAQNRCLISWEVMLLVCYGSNYGS